MVDERKPEGSQVKDRSSWNHYSVARRTAIFADFQNFNPHLHVLATDGGFYKDAAFIVCPPPDTGELEKVVITRY